jgi:hypothetical protein
MVAIRGRRTLFEREFSTRLEEMNTFMTKMKQKQAKMDRDTFFSVCPKKLGGGDLYRVGLLSLASHFCWTVKREDDDDEHCREIK